MGIRNKILLIISLLVLVPILILGGISYMKSADILEDTFITNTQELNDKIADGLKNELSGYTYGIQAIADNVDATNIISNPEYEPFLRSLFANYVDNYPSAFQMYMGTTTKDMFIEPHFDFDSSYDPTQRPWFVLAKENGKPGWTDMYVDAVTGDFSISGYSPVYKKNDFIGSVAISLSLSSISKEISEIQIGKEGSVFVLDEEGTVVFHNDSSQIGKIIPVTEILDTLEEKPDTGVVYYEYQDREKIVVFKYLPETRWYIMTTTFLDEISESTSTLLMTSFIVGLVGLIVSIAIGLLFANSITNPIKLVVSSMKFVEEGDMTTVCHVKSKDEVGQLSNSFNNMVSNVNSLISNASNVTTEVSDASQNLAASAEETSASADEVSRTVGEIASGASEQAMDAEKASELTSNLDQKLTQLHDNSKDVSENAGQVRIINNKGEEILGVLKEVTDKNNESTDRIALAVTELAEKSANIDSILLTISSIAEQTNLLALNASIEAARAGEHGRGFAVVAEEIRKLAEESSNSADQIAVIVKVIQETTNNAVNIMGDVKSNADNQYRSVEDMNTSFGEISSAIDDITNQIDSIDSFINEIIEDKDKIVSSISSISAVSEETAASSEEVSATMEQQNMAVEAVAEAADQLSKLSSDLSHEINKFKI